MSTQALVEIETTSERALGKFQSIIDTAFGFAASATSKNTQRTYAYGVKSFKEWCIVQHVDPLMIDSKEAILAFYAADKAKQGKLKVSSIECYLVGICEWYAEKGIVIEHNHPSIKKVLQGIRNTLSVRPGRKLPIVTEDLKEMVQAIKIEHNGTECIIGIRDRALLLLGFAGAFRRSELVGLAVDDITFTRDGAKVLVRRSKTDQEGAGMEKIIPYGSHPITCPVRALQDWLKISQIKDGPIFRAINRHGHISPTALSGHAVALVIKRNAYIEASEVDNFSGHSLRAGFVTSAAQHHVPEDLIMQQTGHRSINEFRGYIRRGKNFDETAAAMVGL